jgi:hypothetical protein
MSHYFRVENSLDGFELRWEIPMPINLRRSHISERRAKALLPEQGHIKKASPLQC